MEYFNLVHAQKPTFFLLSAIALDIDIQKRLLGRYIYCSSKSRMSGDILINEVTSGTNSTTLSGHIWLLGFERVKLEMYFGCKKKNAAALDLLMISK